MHAGVVVPNAAVQPRARRRDDPSDTRVCVPCVRVGVSTWLMIAHVGCALCVLRDCAVGCGASMVRSAHASSSRSDTARAADRPLPFMSSAVVRFGSVYVA